jgi:hypothetical protein
MTPSCIKNRYQWVNGIFLIVILAVLAYATAFDAEHHRYPLKSGADLFGNGMAASKGLSRSFSEIVRLDFEKAERFNPYGLRIFAFFAVQLLMRTGTLCFLWFGRPKRLQVLVVTDVLLSLIIFTFCFWPFLVLTMEQLVNISLFF